MSACIPFLVELCHRKHSNLVLCVSFNLCVLNDQNHLTPPPKLKYAVGMDVVLKARAIKHLKKMYSLGLPLGDGLRAIAMNSQAQLTDSEGEWVPPESDLWPFGLHQRVGSDRGSPSGSPGNKDEAASLRAAADTARPRGEGTHWTGKLRKY